MEIITDKKEIFKYFLIFALINALLLYYIHDIIITDPQHFTGGNMNSVRLYRNVWKGIYIISPIYAFAKILIISFLIYQAIKMIKKIDTQFWGVFYIVLLAQIILLIPDLLELIWFTFIKTDYSMMNVDHFKPLSIVNLVNYKNISDFTFKILSSINLFNIFYWGAVLYLLKRYINSTTKDSIKIVFCFYGSITLVFSLIYLAVLYKIS